MATKTRVLSRGGPYILIRRDNLKTQRCDYIVRLDTGKWQAGVHGATGLGNHFGLDNFAGIWSWKYKTKAEVGEMISLAILKGIV